MGACGQNSLEATKSYIASVEEQIIGGGYPLIGLCLQTGKFVVATGLTKTGNVMETGYWVAKDFQGRGYASETANAVIRFGFGAFGLNEMHINHYEGNEKASTSFKNSALRLRTQRPMVMRGV